MLNGHEFGTMPAAYVGGLGLEGTLALKQYTEQGGTLIALDEASDFVIDQFGLPVRNAVAGLSSDDFFIPGSLIQMKVDTQHPLAYGMQPVAAAAFVRSRAFANVELSVEGEGGRADLKPTLVIPTETIAEYSNHHLLLSGWALGEAQYIGGHAAMMRVKLGGGNVILTGFRPQFRGQARGTYKLLFNTLYAATLSQWPERATDEPRESAGH